MESNAHLWQKYNESQNESTKREIVLAYLYLVKHIAGRLSVKFPAGVSREDLESCGILGLLEAIDKYDVSQGTGFEAFAYRRIQGAMYDELRRANWIPRTTWQKLNRLYMAKNKVENKLGRSISSEELAKQLGIPAKEVHRLNSIFTQLTALSLDESLEENDQSISFSDILPDPSSPDPLQEICSKDERDVLTKAVGMLDERDRLILSLYYHEELTLKEIGQVLEITESRVCQLHSRAITRLRKKLQEVL
jgi:RNA polymerase sigma factor for flagellar operon FliA